MEGAHSPKFGNLESNGDVPYARHSDNFRKVRSEGELVNHSDPQRKASRPSGSDRSIEHSPLHPHYQVKSAGKGGVSSPAWERKGSADGAQGIPPNTPERSKLRTGGRGDDTVTLEHSPLHPHYQVKSAGKGEVSSPAWERKGSAEGAQGIPPNTPERSKPRTGGRGDDTPEKSAEVPKFGEWDETNPSSADRYTDIFNKVREERQAGSNKDHMITDDSKYLDAYHKETTCCWGFNWCRK